jgi:hypothetical protein
LSRNPNITLETIMDNPDKPWDFDCLSENILLYDPIVNQKEKTLDIKLRYSLLNKIFEETSSFSRNIDKVIKKRLSYR